MNTEKQFSTRESRSQIRLLIIIASIRLLIHLFANNQYGFHRDELAMLDNAEFLDWGYVAYPPLTAFFARISLELFGLSLVGLRFFTSLAQSIGMVLVGLMAYEMGGGKKAQLLAALSAGIAPMSLIMASTFQYIGFDYLWWILTAYFLTRLVKSGDGRWWIAIGLSIGLGMMTKYTMGVLVFSLVIAILFSEEKRHLKERWLWMGAIVSIIIFLPNLLWQIENQFVSIEFLSSIRVRDLMLGRTDDFFPMQFIASTNSLTIPIWVAGLYYLFRDSSGRKYRILLWSFAGSFLIFLLLNGRFYYTTSAYASLFAAGAVAWEKWLNKKRVAKSRTGWRVTWVGLGLGGIIGAALMMPIAPVNSALWDLTSEIHDNFAEEIGWEELVETINGIFHNLPDNDQQQTGILARNYGAAGAINLLGQQYGLPRAISGINSYWQRGYGNPPPKQLIVLGFSPESADLLLGSCEIVGRVSNRYGVLNEETRNHPDILLCSDWINGWPELWKSLRSFG